ncbi:MAG: glycogen/starch synthase [Bacteroidota bacterium]
MRKAKILFISAEITPYLEETSLAHIARYLPAGVQDKGKEIRTFMPRFGCINERRNQLHEVIRLSGMNLIIDETDHPLIIKVASIQSARMQVYFIDNDEYFSRKNTYRDGKKAFYPDNDSRTIFFCRGVLETVKKLGWSPDLIHCHGWITSLIPLYLKTSYKDDPIFMNSKVVYSVYNHDFPEVFNEDYARKVKMKGMSNDDLKLLKTPDYVNINLAAMKYSDAVIQGSDKIHPDLAAAFQNIDKPSLGYHNVDEYVKAYAKFYDELLAENLMLVE